MSSGKKAQRVKGNTKPSSSSRAAEFLHQDGQKGFVGFASLAENNFGYVPQPMAGDEEKADSEFLVLMRKMTKKDTVTRLKAIQEFASLCKEKDQSVIHMILSYWPRIYSKISNDYDHRVREASQQAHHQMVTKAGRKLAPFLKQIITTWLMAQYDTYTPAANAARTSFLEVFQEKKKKEVLIHCKDEIIESLHYNIMNESPDTLSDPKMIPVEERESKYARFLSSSFLVFKYFMESVTKESLGDSSVQIIYSIASDKKFWKFSKHNSSLIRSSFYQLVGAFANCFTDIVYKNQKQFCVAVLTNFDEVDPLVVNSLWEASLVLLSNIEGCWDHVNARKAVLPKIWKQLRNFCCGNTSVVYPNLLPFLSTVSPNVIGEDVAFYQEFFEALMDGLIEKQENSTVTDATLAVKAFIECIEYLLNKSVIDENIKSFLIEVTVQESLRKTFSSDHRFLWFGILYKELSGMLRKLFDQNILTKLWNVIGNVIFIGYLDEDQSSLKFRSQSKEFFDSVLDFVYSLHQNTNSNERKHDQVSLLSMDVENQRKFISSLITCYVNTINEQQHSWMFVTFINILLLLYDEQPLNILNSMLHKSDLPLVKNIVQNFYAQQTKAFVLNSEEKTTLSKLMLRHVILFDNADDYLRFLFQSSNFDDEMMLYLLCGLFSFEPAPKVENFLISTKVQEILLNICKPHKSGALNEFRWKILENYLSVTKATPDESFNDYSLKLLNVITNYMDDEQSTENIEHCLKCFTSSTKFAKVFNSEYFDTFYKVLNLTLNTNDSSKQKRLAQCVTECFEIVLTRHDDQPYFLQSCFLKLQNEFVTNHVYPIVTDLLVMIFDVCVNVNVSLDLLIRTVLKSNTDVNLKKEDQNNVADYNILVLNLLSKTQCFSDLDEESTTVIVDVFLTSLENSYEKDSDSSMLDLVEEIFEKADLVLLQACMRNQLSRCVTKNNVSPLINFCQLLYQSKVLSEDLLDYSLIQSAPNSYSLTNEVDCYCVIISYLNDISGIRAMIEKCIDELENDKHLFENLEEFSGFIQILSALLSQWFNSFIQQDIDSLQDFDVIITKIFTAFTIWKEVNNDHLLFGCSLEGIDDSKLRLNVNVMNLLRTITETSVRSLSPENWDFLLCAVVSWMQALEESMGIVCFENRLLSDFYSEALELMHSVAKLLEKQISEKYSSYGKFTEFPIVSTNRKELRIGFDISEQLSTEWKEFFSPASFKSALALFFYESEKGSIHRFSRSLCQSICLVTKETLLEVVYAGEVDERKQETLLKNFVDKMFDVLNNDIWFYQLAVYHVVQRLSMNIESSLCETNKEKDEDEEETRLLPDNLFHQIMESRHDKIITYINKEGGSIDIPLVDIDQSIRPSLFTYMLSWLLILNIFSSATPDNRARFANYFYKNRSISELSALLFCLVPKEWRRELYVTKLNNESLQDLSCWVLAFVLESTPALFRSWYNNSINRKHAIVVEKFISSNISPILLRKEFMKVDETSKSFDNMTIKTRQAVREIIAVYTVEEISMELQVKMANNYPLSPVAVDCGKRIGVNTALWRQWMLQLTSFLSFQNGSIVEGLSVWKKNVDKRFEGVEECMVCFSIIHASNYSLPTTACKTCKKKFHPVCLYKWFSTSGKSTCPLCRNIF